MSRDAALKAWITRRANAGASPGPAKIASARSGHKTTSSSPKIVNMIGAMAWPGSRGGGAYRSRLAAKNAKAIPAMLAEVKRRGFSDYVAANHGTHFAVYFNAEKKR